MSQDKPTVIGPRPVSWIAILGFALGIAGAVLLLVAVIGVRFDLWHFRFSLLTLLEYAGYLGAAGLILSLVGLGRAWPGGVRRGTVLALVGIVAGGYAAYVPAQSWWKVKTLPLIHDITTDTENPPEFAAVVPEREAQNANPHEYAGEELARKQTEAYPNVEPLIVDDSPDAAYEAALALARERGWAIADADGEAHRIEATDTTFWMGFKDDIVIRITPTEGGGSRIDMRSLSRVGRSDLGKNAARIRSYLSELEPRLA